MIRARKGTSVRILLVTGKLTYSNSTTYSIEVLRGLLARGHEVQVAALGGPLYSEVQAFGSETYLLRLNPFTFRRLLQFLRRFAPDVIHATGGGRALKIAARIGRKLEVPVVHTIHSWLDEDRRERFPPGTSGIIAVNESLREQLVNAHNVRKSLIRVIPYGVDCARYYSPRDRGPRQRLPVVGIIGRLERGRRHHEFVQAAAFIRERGAEVMFLVAGEGPGEGRLRKQVKSAGLDFCFTFVQPQGRISDLYSVLDVLVVVSDWGGVGLSLLEGMAHERSVIATGGGEVYSIFREERICIVVPSGDTDQLANAVITLLDDPELAHELGQNARRFVMAYYPLEEMISRVESYYGDLISAVTVG